MLYLIILIYTIFLVYKYDYRGSKTGIKKHYNILLLLSIFIGGLSYRLGIDTVRYEESFNFLNLNMRYNYEDYSSKFNWCMHRNPYTMPEANRKQFYDDVQSMPFNEMAMKDLEAIRQARKQKKLETKEVRYE